MPIRTSSEPVLRLRLLVQHFSCPRAERSPEDKQGGPASGGLRVGRDRFTCAGGFTVYTNTQHLIDTRNWLDHSHSVLTSLQMESQRLDRADYEAQLYTATGDPGLL